MKDEHDEQYNIDKGTKGELLEHPCCSKKFAIAWRELRVGNPGAQQGV